MRPVSLSRHRRALIAAVLGAASCAGIGLVQAQELPKSPVVINVIDAAGNLALTQGAFEAYQAQNPKLVSKFTFTKAPAPEIPAKIKAMQNAGRSDIDMIIVGTDALAAGLEMNLWVKLFPDHAARQHDVNPEIDIRLIEGAPHGIHSFLGSRERYVEAVRDIIEQGS